MKKVIALLTSLIMVLSMAAPIYADADGTKGNIVDPDYLSIGDSNGDASGHDVTTTVVKEATCGEAGYHYNYCSLCKHYVSDLLPDGTREVYQVKTRVDDPAKIDDGVKCTPADKWTTIVEATCTEAGTIVKYCTECGAICDTDGIECKRHDSADEWTTLVAATFTNEGTRVKYCNRCGEICYSDIIAKLKLGKAYQPKLSSPAKAKLKIKIKKANKYATGYQIAYKKAGGAYKFINVNGKTPSKTLTNLAKGKKYAVKVRPIRVEGSKTFYGEYSTIKTVKIK